MKLISALPLRMLAGSWGVEGTQLAENHLSNAECILGSDHQFSKSARPLKFFGVDLIPKGSDPSMSMTGGLAGRSPEWRPQWTCYA